jgi:hypothetical protein
VTLPVIELFCIIAYTPRGDATMAQDDAWRLACAMVYFSLSKFKMLTKFPLDTHDL